MLKNSFCSSPWFHVRKTYDGSYEVCRWADRFSSGHSGNAESIMKFYNGKEMTALRNSMLAGQRDRICNPCYYQDDHGKLSGRARQLLKSGVQLNNFETGMLSSPHLDMFKYSQEHQGQANYYPVDLQIDLGRACNSSCIMCFPEYSSRLITDYQKLSQIEPEIFSSPDLAPDWTLDSQAVEKFAAELESIPDIKYIHFLGGETLFNQSLYTICNALIQTGSSHNIIVGTTTNGTIYDERIELLIPEFKQFHLGISIETVSPLNDYIRWPSNVDQVKANIQRFVKLRDAFPGLVLSARITPNLFTISEIAELLDYLFEQGVIAESCNLLYKPEWLRIELIPQDIREETISKLEDFVSRRNLEKSEVYNVRNPGLRYEVLANTAIEYLQFMKTFVVPDDVNAQRKTLVKSLKAFESLRGNSIINYAPRYTDFLRSIGY